MARRQSLDEVCGCDSLAQREVEGAVFGLWAWDLGAAGAAQCSAGQMELVNGACRKQRSRAPLSQTHVAKGPLTGRYCVRPAYDLGSEFVSFKEISPGERNRQTPGKSRGRRYAKISLVGGVVWLAMEGGVCRASVAQHRVSSRTGGVEGGGISGKKGGAWG